MDFSKVNWGLVTELYNFPTHRDRIPGILHPNKSSFGVWWGLCSGITFPDNFSGILGNGLFLSSSEHTCCKNIPLKFRKRRLSLFPQSLDFHPGFICNFLNRNKKNIPKLSSPISRLSASQVSYFPNHKRSRKARAGFQSFLLKPFALASNLIHWAELKTSSNQLLSCLQCPN